MLDVNVLTAAASLCAAYSVFSLLSSITVIGHDDGRCDASLEVVLLSVSEILKIRLALYYTLYYTLQ